MTRRKCVSTFAWILVSIAASSTHLQAQTDGEWSDVLDWPIQAIHTTMLPTGKVMIWQTWTQSVGLWDPQTQQFSSSALPDINIFCSGHAWLPDGRLLVVGGHIANNTGESVTNIYDPFSNSWANNVANMNAGRWYPSATTLGDGRVLVTSGDVITGLNNEIPQIYDAATNTWDSLTSAQKSIPLYPRTFLSPDGNLVSMSNWGNRTEKLNLSANGGNGQWQFIDHTLHGGIENYGSAVMYEPGKVAFFGGGDAPTSDIAMIDFNEANPQWRRSAEVMAQPRRQNDATILADGTVLITGGSSLPGWNNPDGRIPAAEIWDPITETTRQVAEASNVYRGYHSTSTLLPDGRVLVTGGDHDHNGAGPFVNNTNAEIYSPPYLFAGNRPSINSAPDSAELGTTFFVATPDAADIDRITFLVPGSTTHSQNWTQRINHLEFVEVDGGVNVMLPSNPNHAPPGYYMLFLISDDGVPSVAEFVRADLRTSLVGDFNGDSQYSCADVDALVADIAGGTNSAQYDIDSDGFVTNSDLTTWLAAAGAANNLTGQPYLFGDANLDGTVDGQDFIQWNDAKFTNTAAWCSGDFNADGFVDGLDFVLWNDNKFQSSDAVAVPEPGTSALVFVAGLLLWILPRMPKSNVL